jgi:hypothetical protein
VDVEWIPTVEYGTMPVNMRYNNPGVQSRARDSNLSIHVWSSFSWCLTITPARMAVTDIICCGYEYNQLTLFLADIPVTLILIQMATNYDIIKLIMHRLIMLLSFCFEHTLLRERSGYASEYTDLRSNTRCNLRDAVNSVSARTRLNHR